MSLQRRPVVFARSERAFQTALKQIQSRNPQMSALVLLTKQQSDSVQKAENSLDLEKMRILIIDSDHQDAFHKVEKWITEQGLA